MTLPSLFHRLRNHAFHLVIAIFEFHHVVLAMVIEIGIYCFYAKDYCDGEVTLLCALPCDGVLLLLLLIACGLPCLVRSMLLYACAP
jgi:hypothetical protein